MMTPTIHINGTSRDELLSQNIAVISAIGDAIDALRNAAPNGRDYYPQGDAAMRQAVKEHADRLARLNAVQDELTQIAEAAA